MGKKSGPENLSRIVSGKLTKFRIRPGSHPVHRKSDFKGIDRPFGEGVKSRLIRSLLINWRLGNFFFLLLNGFHHKISKKPTDPA
jgi:hypothetical protein